MLLPEFVKLTGFHPTIEYFDEVIHPAYMQVKDDKETWCKAWKRKGGIQAAYDWQRRYAEKLKMIAKQETADATQQRELNEKLTRECIDLHHREDELTTQVLNLTQERKELVEFLIQQAEKWSAAELRAQAIAMIGERAYLAYKIEHGMTLWEEDRAVLVATLKEDKQ
jgi:hypothetical protein